ncbi:MAG: tol-pal system protein YbgF [Gammaproteobacteria bacterium]
MPLTSRHRPAPAARRRLALALALAAACLAPPALAQRASLADRIALLEQQAAASQGNVELLNQIAQLRTELRDLRAQIEELQRAQEQQAQSARSQYLDLDSRITRLEGGTPAVAAGAGAVPAAPAASAAPAPADRPGALELDEAAPSVHGDAGLLARGQDEREDYLAAFELLKSGDYVASARAFQQFLQLYPAGTHAPNALYWLGESYYVTQNYPLAGAQFRTLLDRYPTHDKAPGALLKLGLSQYGEQRLDAAEATLLEVVARYPGTDAARIAEDRLRAIGLTGMR